MQHLPSSSAAPAVPDANTNTNKTPINRPNEKIMIDDKLFQPKVDLSKSVVEPGPFIDVFDAKLLMLNPPKYGGLVPIRDFKKDPSLFRRLTECATLAIGDYNSQTKSDYRFVDIEMATSELVNGIFYHITFQARDATKKYETFEATVFLNSRVRKVEEIRMKRSDTWYDGTLSEPVN